MTSTVEIEITNGRKAAGGHNEIDTHGAIAASKVARKGRTSANESANTGVVSRSSKQSRASGASGHEACETHAPDATRKVARKGRTAAIVHPTTDLASPQSTTHTAGANPSPAPIMAALPQSQSAAVIAIYTHWRKRQALVKAMTKLSLQGQAVLRAGMDREEAAKHYAKVAKDPTHEDHIDILPYLDAMATLEKHRTAHEKVLAQTVKTLPIYGWAKGISGLGEISLAGLVGECSGEWVGDGGEAGEFWTIGQMKSVSALWKRLGLAVMSGVRQGDATAGLSKDDWVEHGYVRARRSVVWNIGECIVKAQWRKENTVHSYGKYYGEEKARLQARNEAGEYAEQAARIVDRMRKAGSKPLAENLAGRLTASHINNRAKRHMTKRLLRDLYVEWHRLDSPLNTAPKLQAA